MKDDKYRGAGLVFVGIAVSLLGFGLSFIHAQPTVGAWTLVCIAGIGLIIVGLPVYAKAQWRSHSFWPGMFRVFAIVVLPLVLASYPLFATVSAYQCAAETAEAYSVLQQLVSAETTFYAENGHYASTFQELKQTKFPPQLTLKNYSVFLSPDQVFVPEHSRSEKTGFSDLPSDWTPFVKNESFQIVAAAKRTTWPITLALWAIPMRTLDVWTMDSERTIHNRIDGCGIGAHEH